MVSYVTDARAAQQSRYQRVRVKQYETPHGENICFVTMSETHVL